MSDSQPATSTRSIVPCNFRSAGRLSNESTRHLRSLHETFARNLSHSLDLFLGSPLEVKLSSVDQVDARAFISATAASGYFVPFSIASMPDRVVVRFAAALLFPLLDLILGGPGEPDDHVRELTEIDEELIRSITELICSQLERAWKCCQVTLVPNPSVKPATLGQILTLDERVTVLRFNMTIASVVGDLELVLPMAFTNALIRGSQSEAPQRVTSHVPPQRRLRDRLLQCEFAAVAELSGLSLSVGDLIGLRPGDLLNLHAPVASPPRLKIDGLDLFELSAVRHKNHKAAQLLNPCR